MNYLSQKVLKLRDRLMTKHKTEKRIKKTVKLDKTSGISLWRQIADRLRADMIDLADETGRLPPEPELASLFKVNRLTLRSAVKALVEEGLLSRQQGKGTYIQQKRRLKYPISRRTRFSEGLNNQADQRSVTILDYQQEKALPIICEKLNLSEDAHVVRVETLSIADKMPIVRSTSWFCAKRFKNIGQLIKKHQSVTHAFRLCGVDDYVRQSTEVEARHANEADSRDLKLAPGGLILMTEVINTEINGTVIQYSRSRMAAERITLLIR